MAKANQNIVIAGAGLVGSLLAYALQKRGHSVTLFEMRNDMRKEEATAGRSINLVVTSRGIDALQKVGLLKEAMDITVPVMGRMMHDREGNLTYQPYGKDDSECNYSISRAELNMLLMNCAEEAGVTIHFEAPLESVDLNNKTARFVGHENISFNRFFGADGANSKTRKELLRLVKERGGDCSESMTLIESDYKELFMPANSAGEYPIEKNALHIWPRETHMLMALPNNDGSFTMTLYQPREKGVSKGISFEELCDESKVEELFIRDYQDTIKLMPNYKKEFFENPQGVLGTVRCSPWVLDDSLCLVGDAAHAIVPFFGQGMNCGFEDVSYLLDFLDQSEWGEAFSKYGEFQKPNGDAIADMALENFIEMRDKVGDKKFLLEKAVEKILGNTFPEKYRARYGLVTYTLVPYSHCFKIGLIQSEILSELCSSINDAEEVDLKKAEELIDQKLVPYQKEHKISLDRFTVR